MQMTKLAFGVSYCGRAYYGWQKQSHSDNTIQHHVDYALSFVANHPVESICAGRTDSGVHGTGQVIHMETEAVRSLQSWKMGVNTNLPRDIRIDWVVPVDSDFHARFSAHYRRYQYVIADESLGSAIFHGLVTPCRHRLDERAMHEAAQVLLGEQDFSSFRAAQCQSNTAQRYVEHITVYRSHGFVVVDIQANAFLYHMVRNIVGSLLVIGQGKKSALWLKELLDKRDRRQAPATALADGLYLVEVGYSSSYNIPLGGVELPFIT